MLKHKFIFAVSLMAVLTVSNAYADNPASTSSTTDNVGTAHTVYTAASNVGTATTTNVASGIAGVTYVNRMVNVAGNAAQKAEAHAAAAGASALTANTAAENAQTAAENAAASAQTANNALAGKVATEQGSTNANKIMITNASGTVTPVVVTTTGDGGLVTGVSVADGKLTVTKGSSLPTVNNATLTIQKNGTTVDTFTANASGDKTINITVPTGALASKDTVATADITDSAVTTAKIANNAVTVAKTTGIFGYIPTSSSGTGSAQIWVE